MPLDTTKIDANYVLPQSCKRNTSLEQCFFFSKHLQQVAHHINTPSLKEDKLVTIDQTFENPIHDRHHWFFSELFPNFEQFMNSFTQTHKQTTTLLEHSKLWPSQDHNTSWTMWRRGHHIWRIWRPTKLYNRKSSSSNILAFSKR